MVSKAAPLTAFAIFGFLVERYGAERSRNPRHVRRLLRVRLRARLPTGDGHLRRLARRPRAGAPLHPGRGRPRSHLRLGYRAFVLDDSVGVAIAAVLLVLVGAQVAAVAVPAVYGNAQSDDNNLVQYAQPGGDPRAELQTIGAVASEGGNGTDVLLYYGEQGGVLRRQPRLRQGRPERLGLLVALDTRPLCARWYNSLPFPWYFAKDDADVDCTRERAQLESRIQSNPPPVIITQDADSTVPTGALESSYTRTTYEDARLRQGHDVLDSQRRPDRERVRLSPT